MEKLVRVVFIAIIVSFMFTGATQAAPKGDNRVIFEENTSFKDAKHRAKVLSKMRAKDPGKKDNQHQEKSSAEGQRGNILGLLEKFFGKDVAALLNGNSNENVDEQLSGGNEKKEKGVFREFPDEPYQWDGIRRDEVGKKNQ